MEIEEGFVFILNTLLSILINGVTTLADRFDTRKKKDFDDLKKYLKEQNILQLITVESLKKIKVDSREVDQLKILAYVNNGDLNFPFKKSSQKLRIFF
jgi:hypothetical protein